MIDTPENSDSAVELEPRSHLKDHLTEVMAVLRIEAMETLVRELVISFQEENYRFDEFVDALASYAYLQPGWGEVVNHLEAASSKITELRRKSEGLPTI